ncbi:hypothetical protein [Streptomyces narbonensis]
MHDGALDTVGAAVQGQSPTTRPDERVTLEAMGEQEGAWSASSWSLIGCGDIGSSSIWASSTPRATSSLEAKWK